MHELIGFLPTLGDGVLFEQLTHMFDEPWDDGAVRRHSISEIVILSRLVCPEHILELLHVAFCNPMALALAHGGVLRYRIGHKVSRTVQMTDSFLNACRNEDS